MKNRFCFRIFQKILSFLSVVILVGSMLLLGNVIYQRVKGAKIPMIFGWGVASVETGSMEPAMPIGSFIFIKSQESYRAGDIITYKVDSMRNPVTHRIVSIQNGMVTAKGDANNVEDKPFAEDAIIGEVKYIAPGVGLLLSELMNPVVLGELLATVIIVWAASITIQRSGRREANGQKI